MTRAFKNDKAAGADDLLGEGRQDPRSEEGAEERGGREGERVHLRHAQRARCTGVGLLQ